MLDAGQIKRFLAYSFCVAAGFLLGFLFTSKRPATSATSQPPDLAATPPPSPASSKTPARSERASSSLEKLRTLLSTATAFDSLSEAWPLIHQLTLAECKSALSFIRETRRSAREALLDALAQRWANLDPLDAYQTAQASRDDNDWRNRLGLRAGAALVAADPEAALAEITSARDRNVREKAAEWILPAVARNDPLRASSFLSANQNLGRYHHVFRIVAQIFSQTAPQQSIAWANTLTDKLLREQTVTFAWVGWVESDPATAAAALQKDPKMLNDSSLVNAVAANWSRTDVTAALKWIESIPDERNRNEAYNSIDFTKAKLSPDSAREILLGLPDDARNRLAEKVGLEFARDNVDQALAWAGQLPADKSRANALNSILSYWSNSDPSAAARYLATQPTSKQNTDFLARAMHQWNENDPDAADKFLQTLPRGAERDAATAGMIQSIEDPKSARAVELFESIQDRKVAATVADRFISSLARSDPDAAFRLAGEMPAEAQPKLYHDLMRGWAFEHTAEAGQWLNTLTPGPARDSAIEGYVSVIDGMDPAKATQWASAINEPTKRIEVIFQAVDRWFNKDPVAAKTWIDQADIPDPFRPFFDKMLKEKKPND
ncbi:MAG TPA: hypothetical protein VM680_14340 [Verrucomicrobiae bacterium]|nr:hypothetical protein [Verrucomicrobiae bacterium]